MLNQQKLPLRRNPNPHRNLNLSLLLNPNQYPSPHQSRKLHQSLNLPQLKSRSLNPNHKVKNRPPSQTPKPKILID